MLNKKLNKFIQLKEEINELEAFIHNAESLWEGKIITIDRKYIFKTIAYGAIQSTEFHMKPEIKNKVLEVLKIYLADLKNELCKAILEDTEFCNQNEK